MVQGRAVPVMNCDNCQVECEPAFTLAAYPSGNRDPVLTDFCSSGCLEEWTSGDGPGLGRWKWGVRGDDDQQTVTGTR